MLGRGVTNMLCEAPARVQPVGVTHVAVARYLRHDRRRRDRRAGCVTVDNRALRALELRNREAVDQAKNLPRYAVRGGDAATNAAALKAVVAGEKHPATDAFLLNAAAAIVVADGLEPKAATARAREALASGAAARKLETWQQATLARRPG